MLCLTPVHSQDKEGSWWNRDEIKACCSEADALYADDWELLPDGSVRARITGTGPRQHQWAEKFLGQEHIIPKDKVRNVPGNPTGRPILFMNSGGYVFCFVMGALI